MFISCTRAIPSSRCIIANVSDRGSPFLLPAYRTLSTSLISQFFEFKKIVKIVERLFIVAYRSQKSLKFFIGYIGSEEDIFIQSFRQGSSEAIEATR